MLELIAGHLERAPPNEHQVLSLRTSHILLFMTKGNTGFRASLSILKRELLHLETAWETLSVHSCLYAWKIALHLTLFTNPLGMFFCGGVAEVY